MSVYTDADARQQFEHLLDEAKDKKEVMIQRPNGDLFLLRLVTSNELKQSLPNLGIRLSRQEVVEYVREVRER